MIKPSMFTAENRLYFSLCLWSEPGSSNGRETYHAPRQRFSPVIKLPHRPIQDQPGLSYSGSTLGTLLLLWFIILVILSHISELRSPRGKIHKDAATLLTLVNLERLLGG